MLYGVDVGTSDVGRYFNIVPTGSVLWNKNSAACLLCLDSAELWDYTGRPVIRKISCLCEPLSYSNYETYLRKDCKHSLVL